jgi:hypothetical protein
LLLATSVCCRAIFTDEGVGCGINRRFDRALHLQMLGTNSPHKILEFIGSASRIDIKISHNEHWIQARDFLQFDEIREFSKLNFSRVSIGRVVNHIGIRLEMRAKYMINSRVPFSHLLNGNVERAFFGKTVAPVTRAVNLLFLVDYWPSRRDENAPIYNRKPGTRKTIYDFRKILKTESLKTVGHLRSAIRLEPLLKDDDINRSKARLDLLGDGYWNLSGPLQLTIMADNYWATKNVIAHYS